ncbi:hypothetical protein [Taibaiella koreensis]|uniref:hypothetical protein n=1 Tax=Taibaiella koreensis TaxID=1268548 RepID=UPI0013C2ED5B|nr:hypothetical protein [Taibaiella koreensis]
MKSKSYWLCLALALAACNGFDSLVPFSEPQPACKKSLRAIRATLRGKYFI